MHSGGPGLGDFGDGSFLPLIVACCCSYSLVKKAQWNRAEEKSLIRGNLDSINELNRLDLQPPLSAVEECRKRGKMNAALAANGGIQDSTRDSQAGIEQEFRIGTAVGDKLDSIGT